MKNIRKKLLMNSLLVASVVAPIATVISCGSNSEETSELGKLADKFNSIYDKNITVNNESISNNEEVLFKNTQDLKEFLKNLTTPGTKLESYDFAKIINLIRNESSEQKLKIIINNDENLKLMGASKNKDEDNKTENNDNKTHVKNFYHILKVKKGFLNNKITVSMQTIIYKVKVNDNSKDDIILKSKWNDIEITVEDTK